ncbi:hypothetical protein BD324DRAFT_452116 [Kockovaella imperatae]|uniref:histidine kinase n=1 Tax=Kockovaella imperatae TaxID=4999 RepID=A0A1Y1UEW9_9TREE|nr:hypothetical protein BD324DRAFT_452116 [Kockovaella imperatae]ORX36568.1 hypothetical protein BD324DRAFT_452116 [Kockovaella imperatae]
MEKPSDHGENQAGPSRQQSDPATPVPLAIRSSAAFLHHLHTDPSSHHITLSGSSTGRDGAPGASPSKPASAAPADTGPSGAGQQPADQSTRKSPLRSSTMAGDNVGGPSRGLKRIPSRRRRPLTSASDSEVSGAPPHGASSRHFSEDVDYDDGISLDDPSYVPDDQLPQLAAEEECPTLTETPQGMPEMQESDAPRQQTGAISAEDDSCLAVFLREDVSSASNMMGMLSLGSARPADATSDGASAMESAPVDIHDGSSGRSRRGSTISSGSGGSQIIGRSGSLAHSVASTSALPSFSVSPSSGERLSWSTFARSYAHGLFDPNRIPNPPNALLEAVRSTGSSQSSPSRSARLLVRGDSPSGSTSESSQKATLSPTATTIDTTPSSGGSQQSGSMSTSEKRNISGVLDANKKAFEFEHLPPHKQEETARAPRPDKLDLPSYNFAAATVRLASSHLRESDLAPLGVPSPERELTDPMASVVSPDPAAPRSSASSDPGTSRSGLIRSVSTTYPTTNDRATLLPTIAASPVSTPNEGPSRAKGKAPENSLRDHQGPPHRGVFVPAHRIPAASVPLERSVEVAGATDYFGLVDSPPNYDRHHSYVSQSSSSKTGTTVTATPTTQAKAKSAETTSASLPGSPLAPTAPAIPLVPQPSQVGPLFEQLGWLPAPLPPHEAARRKALYRYNILHTAADVNFDRIAHMTKLVFSAKIVLIALIDAEEQSHKAESGLGIQTTGRLQSLCSHAILSKSGEPFVLLDALKDWRFANNPQVIGPPHVRFYAGAPLQTPDGYNIGSLCIIDDKPRPEFTPRSRLILKEFASVVMREMELWRDKLQLRLRDRIQVSMEKFTRECLEMDGSASKPNNEVNTKMDHVYNRATQLVCSTLDMEGAFILDISQFEMMEFTLPTGKTTIYRADPFISADGQSPVFERSEAFGSVNALPVFASTTDKQVPKALNPDEHERLSEFLRDHKDGRIYENIAPAWIRYMFPQDLRFGLLVPIFGVDNQPFALLGTYTCKQTCQSLEGYELQFLRAIGVIILSAVLRRRMVMADKAKSILISSVSHELRTPLHGILAAAELLSDTTLDANQMSFLKTVQTCGNSLIETVNHVLDFTKLSGSSQGSSGAIKLSRVNLATLVEQTVEGCWIGQRAKQFHGDSEIGSFYAPDAPHGLIPRAQRASVSSRLAHVETVIDIASRERGWVVRCEKGGLRRVIMNLVGNSLKFTSDGYVQVTLREMPHEPGARKIPVEIAVIDTGKGIGKEFLKDQLFHPFSQENPLQTGTGLGLAIVNSIVRSESVNGKVDVWSSEGMGTEIRVSFDVEVVEEDEDTSSVSSAMSMASHPGRGKSLSFFSFAEDYRGQMLSLEVLGAYAAAAGFELKENGEGDVYVIHEDEEILEQVQSYGRPIIFITPGRTSQASSIRDNMRKNAGSLQILYKPIGPAAFRKALCIAVDHLDERDPDSERRSSQHAAAFEDRPGFSRGSSGASQESNATISDLAQRRFERSANRAPLLRRRSAETSMDPSTKIGRPALHPRGVTYHHPAHPSSRRTSQTSPPKKSDEPDDSPPAGISNSPQPGSPGSAISTISLADGGVMLKAATVPINAPRRERIPRVLIVEDNAINRRVLGAFLKKKGIEYAEAIDGGAGVEVFENSPANYWDVILMDISMPVLNGHEATRAIRKIEANRRPSSGSQASTPGSEVPPDVSSNSALASGSTQHKPISSAPHSTGQIKLPPAKILQSRAKIFALTGLATSDDKREAFSSGVDGYLVKPVSLKSLGLIFQKIGYPIDI